VSLPAPPDADPRAYAAVGYPIFGPRALRADVAERVHRALSAAGEAPGPRLLASWMGCPAREVERVVEALADSREGAGSLAIG
jgi:ATP-dependent RNA helicase SUPV3L1/SUV3